MDYRDYFKGKKVTVMGLGLLGRGIGVIKFLADCGVDILVTDLKTRKQLAPALKQLSKYKNIKYVLGEHRLEDFQNKNLIIRAPNAPLDSPYLAEAKKNNIEIEQDASLFVKLVPASVKIVGITGTRGKSTVTHLLYKILQSALRRGSGQKNRKVFLGGNVRGVATLPLLKKIKAGDIVVLELDSWQLQSFGDNKLSPHLAIFTTFMVDHLNYYAGDMKRYWADKVNNFKYQKRGDTLILGNQVKKQKSKVKIKSKLIIPKAKLPTGWQLKIPGVHNEYNAMLAVVAARELGVKDQVIKKVLVDFKGLPGRLELIKEVKGVKYYNDTTATTPDAVMAAVHTLSKGESFKQSPRTHLGKIILIGGGTDKGLDFKRYAQIVPKYLKGLVLFKGTATDKILAVLPKKLKFPVTVVESMKEALRQAEDLATRGDLVLLSPGAASFGIFRNEFDRGGQFNNLVKKI
ncbi:MAG: UDP-N-acetylmuramoyl-L-alanine--D-glutamate ligase [Candidatus Vogelbacteria bacterium]|nr:UDP-N-acetylmuramoyl-L-alanine--D-glutamate ligase [Candidatus Vogelbacteria bacterium]